MYPQLVHSLWINMWITQIRRPGVCRGRGGVVCCVALWGVYLFRRGLSLNACFWFLVLCVMFCGWVGLWPPVPLPHWDFRPLFWMLVRHRLSLLFRRPLADLKATGPAGRLTCVQGTGPRFRPLVPSPG